MDAGDRAGGDEEAFYAQARELVLSNQKASTSWLQRQLRVGYNVAARAIERMEREQLVSKPDHVGRREVLAGPNAETAQRDDSAQSRADRSERQDGMGGGHVAADELRLLIERAERLEEEKGGINDDIKDVMAEAKSRGYDPKAIRKIMAIRKKKKEEYQEEEAILETYMQALGML